MEEKRNCLECGIEIYGRVDKKFCSDQCRNTFNNRGNADSNAYVRSVNYILRKNRRIMEEIILSSNKDVKRVQRNLLLNLGFDFGYYTNIYKTKTAKYYYFCYEYGYNILDNEYLAIVKRDEYLDNHSH
jgi:hypothetical protein